MQRYYITHAEISARFRIVLMAHAVWHADDTGVADNRKILLAEVQKNIRS